MITVALPDCIIRAWFPDKIADLGDANMSLLSPPPIKELKDDDISFPRPPAIALLKEFCITFVSPPAITLDVEKFLIEFNLPPPIVL